MNKNDEKAKKYLNVLVQLESGGGRQLYGDDFGQGPTSAGLFHWNNNKKPLSGDMIPSNFKVDARQYGFNPNDFSHKNQVQVAKARVLSELNNGLDIEQIDAKWNGAKVVGNRYVHVNPERRQALLEKSRKYAQSTTDSLGTQTVYASDGEQTTTQEQQPTTLPDNRSMGAKIGAGLNNAFIRPAEQNVQTALATVGGIGSALGERARSALLGKGTPQTLEQNIEAQRGSLGRMPTLTETFTGERVNPRNVATGTGIKQAAGDILEGALTYGTGGGSGAVKGVLKKPVASVLGSKLLGAASQAGKNAAEALTRGQIIKGTGVGAGYGLGMGTSEQLKQDKSFTDPATYRGIAGTTIGGALAGGTLGGLSKGAQLLAEKNMKLGGNEVGALGSKIRREVGVNPFGDTPEAQQAFQKFEKNDINNTRASLSGILNKTGSNINRVNEKFNSIDDDGISYIQDVFKKNPITIDGGIPTTNNAIKYLNSEASKAYKDVTDIAGSMTKNSVSVDSGLFKKEINKILNENNGKIFGLKSDDSKLAIEGILSKIKSATDKNGKINFSKLDDFRYDSNTKFDKNTVNVKDAVDEMLGKTFRSIINQEDNNFVRTLLPEQRQALDAYRTALKNYGTISDAKWIATQIPKAKTTTNKFINMASGLFAGGITPGNVPTKVLANIGGSKLVDTIQKLTNEGKVTQSVASRIPTSLKKDIMGESQKKISQAKEGLDILTKATKTKEAASKRVQATIKAADKEAKKVLPTIQIGTQKAKSQGIKTLKKVAEKAKKLPTIDF